MDSASWFEDPDTGDLRPQHIHYNAYILQPDLPKHRVYFEVEDTAEPDGVTDVYFDERTNVQVANGCPELPAMANGGTEPWNGTLARGTV